LPEIVFLPKWLPPPTAATIRRYVIDLERDAPGSPSTEHTELANQLVDAFLRASPAVVSREREQANAFADRWRVSDLEQRVSAVGGVAQSGSAGIFINYRRADNPAFAGRLFDRLSAVFGAKSIFMDVDSIDLGVDFVEIIERSLAQCKVMLVVIGGAWLDMRDSDGMRRLDDPHDFVRLEIEAALRRNILVIPILIENTLMPRNWELPDDIAALVRRNGERISHAHFGRDCRDLIKALDRILTPGG